MSKLYSYKGILWDYRERGYDFWVMPVCPIHKIELKLPAILPGLGYSNGECEDCEKQYNWSPGSDEIAGYLRRKLESREFQEAEIVDIDGMQTPIVKTKISKIPSDNGDYWIEAKLNNSKRGETACNLCR